MDFKEMTLLQLKAYAKEKGIQWDKYAEKGTVGGKAYEKQKNMKKREKRKKKRT